MTDLTDLDFDIVALLQEDGRRSTSEISRIVQTPDSTVRRRIDRLLRDKLLRVVAIVEDPARLGLDVHALFAVRVAPSDEKGVIARLQACDEIRWVVSATGAMNLRAEGYFHSLEHLDAFRSQTLAGMGDVRECQVDVVLGIYKNGFNWAAMARTRAGSAAVRGWERANGKRA